MVSETQIKIVYLLKTTGLLLVAIALGALPVPITWQPMAVSFRPKLKEQQMLYTLLKFIQLHKNRILLLQ